MTRTVLQQLKDYHHFKSYGMPLSSIQFTEKRGDIVGTYVKQFNQIVYDDGTVERFITETSPSKEVLK